MDKGRIKEIVDNPKLTPGIHNYCDRWCERCPMTGHCAVFAMEQDEASGDLSHDPENAAFWQRLKDALETALELLGEMAQEAGVDLDALFSEEDEPSRARLKTEVEEHTLVRQAREYMQRVRKWFESEQLKTQLGLSDVASKPEVAERSDIEEVILWYHAFICAKITRAVRQEREALPASLEDRLRDADGSAKVALLAIDRCIAAWWQMRGHFPQRKDRMMDFLVRIDRLRKATEEAFPKARSFVRPGFDEE